MQWLKGKHHSEETKEKISKGVRAALAEKPLAERMKKSRSGVDNSFYGRSHSVESRAAMSEAQKGVVPTVETRAKHAANMKGNTHRRGKKGMPWSEESRAKLRALRLGKPGHPWSDETRRKQAAARSGPGNGNWRGGVTPEHRLIRTSVEYRQWRTAVFTRDDYTCQSCGERSHPGLNLRLQADHIQPFAQYPELRLALENGRTLCTACHKQTPTFGRRYV